MDWLFITENSLDSKDTYGSHKSKKYVPENNIELAPYNLYLP